MKKRILFTVSVLLGGALAISCVSPFYGTARIEPGFHSEAGVCAMSYIGAFGENNVPSIGGLANIALFYGFNPYFQIGTRLGLGYGQSGFILHDSLGNPTRNPWEVFPDAALSLQASIPGKSITPALRFEGSCAPALTAALLLGMGKTERLTLGIRGCIVGEGRGLDLLAIVRPLPKLSVFMGLNPFGFSILDTWPVATLGIGYKLR